MFRSARLQIRALLRLALLVAITLSTLGVPASAQVDEEEGGESFSLHTSFDHYWRRYIESSSMGDTDTARRMLDEIKRLRVERGVFALHDVAQSFVYRGFTHLESGDVEQAREHFRIALDLGPNLPTAYQGLAAIDEREGGLSHLTALGHRLQAQVAAFRSERDGPYAAWNLAFILFAAMMLVFFVFAALMTYRYGVLLYHDVEERVGELLGSKGVLAVTIGLLMVPVIATAGIGWLAAYWLALTFGYQSIKERIVTVLSLLLLLAAAPIMELYAVWSRTVPNPVYQAALSSTTGTFDVDDVIVLREAVHKSSSDRELQFVLAAQYKNHGDYELAAQQYRTIIQNFPGEVEAKINLGNIYFAQRDWVGALVQYNEALQSNSRFAMAYYNKSLAHAENFEFAEREDARAQAERLDALAVASHENLTGSYRVVADVRLDDQSILSKFYGLSEGIRDKPVEAFVDASVLKGWGLRFLAVPFLLAVLIVVLEVAFKERRLTQRCWKCGSAFCGRCQIGTGRKGLCTQCYHLFFMKDGVSAQARNEKLRQVQSVSKMQSVIFRVLSILAPGSGHIEAGMPFIGLILVFVWILSACAIWLEGAVYALPDGILGGISLPTYALMACMGLAFLMANIIPRSTTRG